MTKANFIDIFQQPRAKRFMNRESSIDNCCCNSFFLLRKRMIAHILLFTPLCDYRLCLARSVPHQTVKKQFHQSFVVFVPSYLRGYDLSAFISATNWSKRYAASWGPGAAS